ncbi:lycopene cyclase family protein [Jannaschia sp. R86511]|uniref:lycopene cyclase family protein n=1 Tax=Jannaschia sp. R86511 TaxID=3093853 RepID=UPI0036D3611D
MNDSGSPRGGEAAADQADLVLVGAGGAGLAVLHALAHRDLTDGLPGPVRVVVVDPVPDHDTEARHRTWCFWAQGDVSVAPAVHATWQQVRVSDATRDLVLDLAPYRYHLVRSPDLAALVADEVARAPRLHVERVVAPAEQVVSCRDHAHVEVAGRSLRASLVLDSRPARPAVAGRVFWWQHFRGWTLPPGSLPERRGAGPVASLMDFRTAQPAAGLSFGYLLPLPDGRALAEYTEFSPDRLDDAGYDRALRGYLDLLGVGRDVVPDHVETGAIPMTDGRFDRHVASRVVRIGTAGGATRGSTGYTFAAMLRDGAAVAAAVADGALAGPGAVRLPPAYPARHRWMDGVQLQALDAGRIDGPRFFTDLFARRPAAQVLSFLDGTTDLVEDLGIMAASPTWPMTWTAVRAGLGGPWPRRRGGQDRVPAVPVPTTGQPAPR